MILGCGLKDCQELSSNKFSKIVSDLIVPQIEALYKLETFKVLRHADMLELLGNGFLVHGKA